MRDLLSRPGAAPSAKNPTKVKVGAKGGPGSSAGGPLRGLAWLGVHLVGHPLWARHLCRHAHAHTGSWVHTYMGSSCLCRQTATHACLPGAALRTLANLHHAMQFDTTTVRMEATNTGTNAVGGEGWCSAAALGREMHGSSRDALGLTTHSCKAGHSRICGHASRQAS